MRTMHGRVRGAALLLPVIALSVAAGGCDLAMAHFKERQTAEWKKTYPVQPGARLEIVAEKMARGASIDAAKDALNRIEIQETASPTNVRIETKLQRSSGGLFNQGEQQVHYMVKVPAALEVRFTTVNGGIELTGLKGRVTAETTNGAVKAHDMAGPIEANTTNGGVEVELTRVMEPGVRLGCTNGGIELKLPSDAHATFSARMTNGGISANDLQIEKVGESSRRRLDGTLNGGGPRIELEGTNGGIRIAPR